MMEKTYSPAHIESTRYAEWESTGVFTPSPTPRPDAPTFSIVIPPPNVTGTLHIGHALEHTLIDILVRQKRMAGYDVEWLPGTDHAGIATQNVVERALATEGKTRHSFDRESFIDKVWEWKHSYGATITQQMRRLGIAVDWQRERFTMDAGCAKAVSETFIRLYNQGLIYRDAYIINWCPRCTTALSDIEVNHDHADGHLWHIRYPLSDDERHHIVVATTRPETLLGDMAVAVHPDDSRYQAWVGKTVRLPIVNREIPIIADAAVDPSFGTGAVKVTPAHDLNDYEIGKRNGIPPKLVMSETGQMIDVPEPYAGMDRFECRTQLLADLANQGFLVKTDSHPLNRGHCYRCKTVIEPYLSKQWFVKMSVLAQPAIDAVKSGDVTFVPPRFSKLYFDWMENIREWCISRQIWWGHRIPIWYRNDDPSIMIAAVDHPTDGHAYTQDPDVLDTWFSSALWPFSTFGWPDESADLSRFYPNTALVTGYDILTFWVSRMITMGLALTGKSPFKTVIVHGLVRDIHGKKMSKSAGNAVDPLALIDEFGADALRFSLASLATLGGQDIKYSREKVEASRNFANKVWNASRFVLMGLDTLDSPIDAHRPRPETLADRWILSRFKSLVTDMNHCLDTHHFALGAEQLWEFIWNTYCDWYLELSKIHKTVSLPTLIYVLLASLKALHPYMPFITEEIWKTIQSSGKITGIPDLSISLAPWPVADWESDPEAETTMTRLIGLIKGIRTIRQELNVAPSKDIHAIVVIPSEADRKTVSTHAAYLTKMAKIGQLDLVESATPPDQAAAGVLDDIQFFVPLAGLIDIEKEMARLSKKRDQLAAEITTLTAKLDQPVFIDKAPAHVVQKLRDQLATTSAEFESIQTQLRTYQ